MISNILDIARILLVCVAFFAGYQIGFANETYDPVAQLHFMIPVVIVAIAGISGLEGLLFARQSAQAKGFETGSNYQKQSSIALLSYAAVAWFVHGSGWGLHAELTIFFAFVFFFFFSGLNHGIEAFRRKNYAWQNVNRPFITLLLIAGMIYPVVMALKEL